MTLFLIGLGLGDEQDITLKGLAAVKKANLVYLEHYTSVLGVDKERLERFYGREVIVADRDLVEKHAEERLLAPAMTKDVCLLVVGDPFGATTHTDLSLRAHALGVPVKTIHNASIMDAVGEIGLELYKYGRTTSIPFWDEGFEPETPYDVIKENRERGCHTLCLLDIKVAEPSKDELLEGTRKEGAKPRFMTVNEALRVLLKIERRRKGRIILPDTLVVGVARLGHPDQEIVAGPLETVLAHDFGAPLHSLIIPCSLQVVEGEALERWERV